MIRLTVILAALMLVGAHLIQDERMHRFADALISDAASFCTREPDACREGVAIARHVVAFTASAFQQAADHANALTPDDRALSPPPSPSEGEARLEP